MNLMATLLGVRVTALGRWMAAPQVVKTGLSQVTKACQQVALLINRHPGEAMPGNPTAATRP